jgi:hypothetical protein
MITIDQYVGTYANSPDWNDTRIANATNLLAVIALLEQDMTTCGVVFPDNPATTSGVSGETNGGFRPQDCPIGAPDSAHKTGQAVDRYDPDGLIDAHLMANQDKLVKYGIYIEHPDSTPGWSHWSTRAPGSGHHVFYP